MILRSNLGVILSFKICTNRNDAVAANAAIRTFKRNGSLTASGAAEVQAPMGELPPPSANASTTRPQQTQAQVAEVSEVGFVFLSPTLLLNLLGSLPLYS